MSYQPYQPGPVLRVRLKWQKGNKWSIRKIIKLKRKKLMTSMRFLKPENKDFTGFYFELQDEKGEALYRLVMADPTIQAVSLSNEDGSFTNVDAKTSESNFEVMIPDLDDSYTLLFFSSNNETGYIQEAGKISMRRIRNFKNNKN